jgi:hypothetical protein
VDHSLLTFVRDLEENNLLNTTNIVVLSDHGMTSFSDGFTEKKISDFVDISRLEKVVEKNAYVMVKVAEGSNVSDVVKDFNGIDGVKAYANHDIPEYLKFRDNEKLLDILVVSDGKTYLQGDSSANDTDGVFIPESPIPVPSKGECSSIVSRIIKCLIIIGLKISLKEIMATTTPVLMPPRI